MEKAKSTAQTLKGRGKKEVAAVKVSEKRGRSTNAPKADGDQDHSQNADTRAPEAITQAGPPHKTKEPVREAKPERAKSADTKAKQNLPAARITDQDDIRVDESEEAQALREKRRRRFLNITADGEPVDELPSPLEDTANDAAVGSVRIRLREFFESYNRSWSALRMSKPKEFLKKARTFITNLSSDIAFIMIRSSQLIVFDLVAMGLLLEDAEEVLKTKARYMAWVRKNFEEAHLRYFQQAKRLARMVPFSLHYAGIDKNRLLDIDRIFHISDSSGDEQSFENILREHVPPDVAKDPDGALFKLHVDAIITVGRLQKAGAQDVTFEQALDIASYQHRGLPVKIAEKVGEWLKSEPDKASAIDRYILDRCELPPTAESVGRNSGENVNYALTGFIKACERLGLDDAAKRKEVKESITEDTEELVREAQEWLSRLQQLISAKHSRQRRST